MQSLESVKGLIGLIVIVAATLAALIQLQIRKKIPAVFKPRGPVLLDWHRWAGRTALAGFFLNGVMCLMVGLYPVLYTGPRYLVHGSVAIVAAVVFAGKVWSQRKRNRWGVRNVLPVGLFLWSLQAAIFVVITVPALCIGGQALLR